MDTSAWQARYFAERAERMRYTPIIRGSPSIQEVRGGPYDARLGYPTRLVIARLKNCDLWVWSPVKLTAALRTEVDRLGPVRHLVSPNKLHHLYLQEWKAAYPEAQLWGPQTTIKKRPEIKFRQALQDRPPPEWLADIDQAWFRGSFPKDEIYSLHRPSATAIIADLIQTFSDHFLREHWGWWRFLAHLDGLTQGQACAPLEW